jgi:hypothetical protein
MTDDLRHETIETASGLQFHIFDPRPSEVRIEDIAHALALKCRFAGHSKKFYSIGQHCVYVSDRLEQFGSKVQLAGLLHDAAEAYLADLPGPLKRGLPSFKILEDKVLAVIGNKFKIPFDVIESPDVKRADHFMLAWEYRDLMASGPKMLWFKEKILSVSPESLPCMTLVPCSWEIAEENYLTTFKRLYEKLYGRARKHAL